MTPQTNRRNPRLQCNGKEGVWIVCLSISLTFNQHCVCSHSRSSSYLRCSIHQGIFISAGVRVCLLIHTACIITHEVRPSFFLRHICFIISHRLPITRGSAGTHDKRHISQVIRGEEAKPGCVLTTPSYKNRSMDISSCSAAMR